MNEFLRGTLVVIVGSLCLLIAVVAVDGDDLLAFFGVADVDERILQGCNQIGIHDLGVLADRDGVVVDRGGDADNIGLFPDGAFAAELGVPAFGIVAAGVGVGHENIDLAGSETGKRTGVGIRLHSAAQIRNALAVAILQPQSRVDVTGRGGRAHDAPVGAVEIIPGQFFTGVDLGGQFLTLFGRAGDEQCTVGDSLLVGSLGGLAVVPVLGVVGVLAQTVAGRGQDNLCTVIIQNVGAAGDQANVDGAGFQTFADRLIGGADGDLNVLDVVAFLGQFVLEQLFERLSRSDDLLRLAGGNKSDLQRFNGLGCRVGGFCGIVGVSGVGSVSRFSGCLRVLCGLIAAVCSVRALCSAAGQNAEQHHERKQKCKNFLH